MKRSFTLIEVLISFSLAIIIISIGTMLIHSFLTTKTHSTHQFEESIQQYMRRSQVRNLLSSMIGMKDRKPLITSSGSAAKDKKLLFTRNNGIFIQQQLANEVVSLLFLDEEGLKIALRADPSRKDMEQKKEAVYLIWPKVSDMSWQFLGKKNLSTQSLEWCKEWEEDEIPLAIRLTLSFHESQKEEVITALIKESAEKKTPFTIEMTQEQLEAMVQNPENEEEE